MRRLVLLVMGCVTAAASGPSPLSAQAAPLEREAVGPLEAIERLVAEELELPVETVRVEVVGGLPELVDSVDVGPGGTGRWIATLWAGETALRRFVRVGANLTVPVASRTLERGISIGPEDVRTEERVVWYVDGNGAVPEPIGMVTSRVLQEGDLLSDPAVRPPLLVNGGDEVDAVLERSGITLRVKAEALASAREGELLHVRLTSGKRMSAKAVGPRLVHLNPGGA